MANVAKLAVLATPESLWIKALSLQACRSFLVPAMTLGLRSCLEPLSQQIWFLVLIFGSALFL
jgi:hypothetical protein